MEIEEKKNEREVRKIVQNFIGYIQDKQQIQMIIIGNNVIMFAINVFTKAH